MAAPLLDYDTLTITEPGLFDIPADTYHADPVPQGSLSSTGARKLAPPNCPAVFRWHADHPEPPNSVLDFGQAAHQVVLGNGPQIVQVNADDWRTKAARAQKDAAHAAGAVPLLPAEYGQVHAMAAALRNHPVADALFQPGYGQPEQSLFWVDGPTGVWRRARLDWLPDARPGRMILADYKTTRNASLDSIQRSVHQYGYHQQAAWYLDGARSLRLVDQDAAFVFVFQEKTPPYLVTVVELDVVALRIGRDLNRQAIETYRDCTEAGIWPGHSDDVELISLPPWVEKRHEENW